MNKPDAPRLLVATETALERWQREFKEGVVDEREMTNVSGIPIRPLYTGADRVASGGDERLGLPGQPDYTRGIYATMPAAAPGRSASSSAWARRPTTTSACSGCWNAARPRCR